MRVTFKNDLKTMKNRHNSFYLIHKALRVAMYETATQLQHADFSDTGSTAKVMEQVESLVSLFDSHAHGEDHFYNEPLEAREPGIGKLFEKEHEEDHRLSQVLLQLVADWRAAATPDKRSEVGQLLFYAFNEFVAFNLYHMNKEELELNEALWRNFSDEEILGIEQTLVSQIPPDKMMKYAHWLMRGLSLQDLVYWLTPIQLNAPPQVFEALLAIGREQIPSRKYEALTEQLGVKEPVKIAL